MSLRIVPVSFADACAFVAEHHRHHDAPRGHKFSLGVADGAQLVGVAIVGRPVSRVLQGEGGTLEVLRSATDGTRNANSMLYGAEGESGASLRAAGYRVVAQRPPRSGWDTPSRPRVARGQEGIARTLWEASA